MKNENKSKMECDDEIQNTVQVLQDRYGITREVAETLERSVRDVIGQTFAKAKSSRMDDFVHPPILSSDDIASGLVPIQRANAYVLKSEGDGNCLFTSLRTCLDLRASTQLTLELMASETPPDDTRPCLDGSRGSPNHSDNFKVRKFCVAWYISPPSNLDIEMGDRTMTYVEGGVEKSRPMTRGDFVVMQLSESSRGDIDTGPSEQAKLKRNEIATKYLQEQSRDRVWGSLPLIVAFAHILKNPTAVRIYQKTSSGLIAITGQDVVPPNAPPLPSAEDDDIFFKQEFSQFDSKAEDSEEWITTDDMRAASYSGCSSCDENPADENSKDADDADDADHADHADHADDASASSGSESSASGQENQNFIRLLFNADGGHYDALATEFQATIIRRMYPETSDFFRAL